jgi:hypothetical protein
MKDTPIYIDNSILTAIAVCDTKTLLRYVLGYASRTERATLLSGTAGHEAMAVYFRTGDAPLALDKFTEIYAEWAQANVPPEDGRSYENCHACLSVWFDNHLISKLPFVVIPERIEIGFSFPLTDDGHYVFVGRIDAVVRDLETDHLRIMDHKFTGRVDGAFAKGFTMDSQFSGYIWAGQQQLNEPIDGGFVNGVEFSRLPSDPKRKCPKHGVVYAECGFLHANSKIILINRTPKQIAAWKRDAISLAKRFEELSTKYSLPDYIPAVKQQGQFVYRACSSCDAYDFCAAGRPTQMLDSLFQYSPWTPWLNARGEQIQTVNIGPQGMPDNDEIPF